MILFNHFNRFHNIKDFANHFGVNNFGFTTSYKRQQAKMIAPLPQEVGTGCLRWTLSTPHGLHQGDPTWPSKPTSHSISYFIITIVNFSIIIIIVLLMLLLFLVLIMLLLFLVLLNLLLFLSLL